MNILFDIAHPAQVHLFRNFIHYLIDNQHTVFVTCHAKDITTYLLDYYKIQYSIISKPEGNSKFALFKTLIKRSRQLIKMHSQLHFDIAYGCNPSIAFLTLLYGIPSYSLHEDDDNIIPYNAYLSYPFTTEGINPQELNFRFWSGKRNLHNSYHELAYLHPDNFNADETVLEKYQLKPFKYIVLRKSALTAHHDNNIKGIYQEVWEKVLKLCSDQPMIYSIENEANQKLAPEDMHHILNYAKMVISDSQTMTMESALLGIPNIRYNSFVGKISVMNTLEQHQLSYGFLPEQEKLMLNKLESMLAENPDVLRTEFQNKKNHFLQKKVDFNQWLIKHFDNLQTSNAVNLDKSHQ